MAATVLAHHADFDFVKTSSGFCGRGASLEDVRLMRSVAHALHSRSPNSHGKPMSIKASGGIRTYDDVVKMVKAGANRIGASAGVDIVQQAGKGSMGNAESGGGNGDGY